MLQTGKSMLMVGVIVIAARLNEASAGEYWVDQDPEKCSEAGPGSCAVPYCTVNRAFQETGNNTIWVRPGIYTAAAGVFNFGSRVIHLRSTSANAPADTTLRGRVYIGPAASASLLEGFTVTNTSGTGVEVIGASATIRSNVITGCTNSGIILSNSGSLLSDNLISNNSTVFSGGGILVSNNQDTIVVRIVDCQIVGNTANSSGGGMFAEKEGQLWLVNTTIRGNTATNVSGGGAYFSGIPLAGGGVAGDPCLQAKFRVSMQNNLITCNNAFGVDSGEGGGGVYFAWLSQGELSNCTFSQNQAYGTGAGLLVGGGCVRAYNSVFWDDVLPAPEIANSGNLTIAHSVLEGGCNGVAHLIGEHAFTCSGTNVLNLEPKFLDPDGVDNILCNADDDYRLKREAPGGSPAVDSGDNTKVLADITDVDRDLNTTEATPRDLARRFRFIDDSQILPHGTAIVDMGAYESVRCETSANCLDPADPCEGDAQCTSTWCDIMQLDCNYDGDHDLLCEIALGEADCNNNTCPDADEGAACDVAVISSVYACNDSLPRFQKNTLRLTFKCPVPALPVPPAYPVRIHKLASGGVFEGSDLAATFTYTLESGNTVLRIRDNANTLANQTWYGIRRGLSWFGVGSFKRDYVTVFGDADNTKLTDFADLSFIFGNQSSTPDPTLQNRSDINGDTLVDFADISDAFGFIGSIDPGKPTGHACLP